MLFRFFNFGGPGKKKSSTSSAPAGVGPAGGAPQAQSSTSSAPPLAHQASQGGPARRRGSDRSLSGSAHELAVAGRDRDRDRDRAEGRPVSHSHSQSNLSDIPYR